VNARARFAEICQALPEATVEGGQHLRAAVRGRTFAWLLEDHHGDGMVAVNVKVPPGENTRLADAHPERFHVPAYLGARGWAGLRLDLARTDWEEAEALVIGSYRLVAPKTLAQRTAGGG
jgi:phosphoribosylglycinamide formyltransferase-1